MMRSTLTPEAQFGRIRALVAQVRSEHVRALLFSFLDDPAIAPLFLRAPAANRIHHAFVGGLCEHTLSVLELGWRICDHYPELDRDLITAGCILHDLGKTREISAEEGFSYTDEGELVGHLVLTCQLIHEKAAAIAGFPRELEWHLTHLVVAHHGRREYGSPREPATLEAQVLHALDELDTRVNSFGQIFAAAAPGAAWTERDSMYRRRLFKGPSWNGELPADARRLPEPGLYREGR